MFAVNSNEGYFLHLIKCALKDEVPYEKPNEVEWQKVFEIALRQNAANLCWFSIEKLNTKPEGELFGNWQEVYAKATSKCLKQMMEIDFLSEEFTRRGYDIMFLKGSEIRNYYPSPDMRTMTDIDLLVKSEKREPVREIMNSLGYEEDVMDDGQVDAFKKEPIIYTEIHYDFSYENHAYHDLFHIEWDRLIESDNPHIFKMCFEDLYFFNVGHYVKNMSKVGMGIRGIIDCFVLWNAASDEQKKSILQKFDETELSVFHKNLLKLSEIWFSDAEDDGSLNNVQQYLINMNTYGDSRTKEAMKLMNDADSQGVSKARFLIQRIFPDKETLYRRFGVKKRNPIILPFLWLKRIFLLVFSGKEKKENVKNEYSTVNSISVEEVEYEQNIRKEFGLL